MSEKNKAVVTRLLEAFNTGRFEVLDELVSPGFAGHVSLCPEDLRGPEGLKGFFAVIRAAMPDVRHPSWTMVAEGDLVVTHMPLEGTFTNDFMGMPPNGKMIVAWMANIWRIDRGKAAEWWVNMDTLGFMQQLGAVPPLGVEAGETASLCSEVPWW